MAAEAIKSAIPSHLKPGNGDSEAEFANKHHGKTRSHMVSISPAFQKVCLFLRRVALDHTLCSPFRQSRLWPPPLFSTRGSSARARASSCLLGRTLVDRPTLVGTVLRILDGSPPVGLLAISRPSQDVQYFASSGSTSYHKRNMLNYYVSKGDAWLVVCADRVYAPQHGIGTLMLFWFAGLGFSTCGLPAPTRRIGSRALHSWWQLA